MNRVKSLWDSEPAMFMAVISAGVSLLSAFGLNMTGEQVGAVMAFSSAVVGLVTRQKVTPVDTDLRVPPRLPLILLVAVLGAGVAGCSATFAALKPGAPVTAQQAKLQEISRAVAQADQILTIASIVQDVEIAAHENKRISDSSHIVVQQAFKEFAFSAKLGLTLSKDLTKPDATRMDATRSVGLIGLELVSRIEKHLPPEVAAYLSSLRAVIKLLGIVS